MLNFESVATAAVGGESWPGDYVAAALSLPDLVRAKAGGLRVLLQQIELQIDD